MSVYHQVRCERAFWCGKMLQTAELRMFRLGGIEAEGKTAVSSDSSTQLSQSTNMFSPKHSQVRAGCAAMQVLHSSRSVAVLRCWPKMHRKQSVSKVPRSEPLIGRNHRQPLRVASGSL